jgi:hypothetical protein
MEWREVKELVRLQPDPGWAEAEARRIERAASPGVWILVSNYYEPEIRLIEVLGLHAVRRTFARLDNRTALLRYESRRDVVAAAPRRPVAGTPPR